jgi:hypothetical protein
MATVRDMVQFLLAGGTDVVISEFAGNDTKELFNYLPTVCADKGPVLVIYFAAKECKPEPEGIFHFSVFVVAKNIAQPDLGLTEAQQAIDANTVSTSVYACIDHKILNNQQKFDAVGDTPVVISNGSQTTIMEHKFVMEDY